MGGRGSGRPAGSGRRTTEDSRPLDIRRLRRDGVLKVGHTSGWEWRKNEDVLSELAVKVEPDHVALFYPRRRPVADQGFEIAEQRVALHRTDCRFGGTRTWWICPSCARGAAILYRPGERYACRRCCNLSYTSQLEQADDRAARRANSVRRRLKWKVGILNPTGPKPKGMHWATFVRLVTKHDSYLATTLAGTARRFGLTVAT
jgi:hypothetical protein